MKRFLFLMFVVAAALNCFSADFSSVSSSGHTLYYNIIDATNRKVEVTYPGSVNYWTGYTEPTGNVFIPSSVTHNGNTYMVSQISDNAFYSCEDITGVTIPNTVISIGAQSFWDCSITTITIPNSVISIGYAAFDGNISLSSINVANSVEQIGWYAFGNAYYSWMDPYPDGVVYLGKVAYIYKGSMPANTHITLASDTKGIAGGAFYEQMNLTSITLPNSLKSIREYAFYGCGGITQITIPSSVNDIALYSFAQCGALTTVNYNCNDADFTGYWIYVNYPYYYNGAFYGCDNITTINIGNSVQKIPHNLFEGCSHVNGSLTLPNSLTVIEDYAFRDCTGLTSVNIPQNVIYLGRAFYECTSLQSVNYNATNCIFTTRPFYGCTSLTTIIFGNNVIRIPSYLCENITSINSISLPNSLTRIDTAAFYHCSGITGELVIPNNVKYIGSSAFSGCSGITSLTIGISVESIEGSFNGMTGLNTVNYNANNCANSASGAMISGNNITSFNIGTNVQRIPDQLIYSCPNLTSVVIPNGVTYIGKSDFASCGLYGEIDLPANLTQIGSGAFMNNYGISSVKCNSSTPPTVVAANGVYNIFNGSWNKPLYVPSGSVSAYQSAPGWSNFTNILSFDAIDDNVLEQLQVYALSNEIIVNGVEGQSLSVWGIDGRNIAIIGKASDQTTIHVPTEGIYIVRIGTNTVKKVVVR